MSLQKIIQTEKNLIGTIFLYIKNPYTLTSILSTSKIIYEYQNDMLKMLLEKYLIKNNLLVFIIFKRIFDNLNQNIHNFGFLTNITNKQIYIELLNYNYNIDKNNSMLKQNILIDYDIYEDYCSRNINDYLSCRYRWEKFRSDVGRQIYWKYSQIVLNNLCTDSVIYLLKYRYYILANMTIDIIAKKIHEIDIKYNERHLFCFKYIDNVLGGIENFIYNKKLDKYQFNIDNKYINKLKTFIIYSKINSLYNNLPFNNLSYYKKLYILIDIDLEQLSQDKIKLLQDDISLIHINNNIKDINKELVDNIYNRLDNQILCICMGQYISNFEHNNHNYIQTITKYPLFKVNNTIDDINLFRKKIEKYNFLNTTTTKYKYLSDNISKYDMNNKEAYIIIKLERI